MTEKFVTQANLAAYTRELSGKVAQKVSEAAHLKRKIAAGLSSIDVTAADAD